MFVPNIKPIKKEATTLKGDSITLRPRQKEFVKNTLKTLNERNRCLAVAPTGAGKTIMMSAIIGRLVNKRSRVLVLQHRSELVQQNKSKFELLHPDIKTSVVSAKNKDFSGQVIFAMVQTLAKCLKKMPRISILAIDEAHHSAAPSWKKTIDHAHHKNPMIKILGVTATPQRGDRKSLKGIFDTLSDHIKLKELVRTNNLVIPRTFVLDLGNNEDLKRLYGRKKFEKDSEGNLVKSPKPLNEAEIQEEAARILDHEQHTQQVIEHWKEKAYPRKTVIFCTNRNHARNVQEAFVKAGISAATVTGDTDQAKRDSTLKDFAEGQYQVITNVAVLTEGWDCPAVSCIILLRPTSYKSTMIQMVGRGLRTHPDKRDCLILDFGMSSIVHGSLEQEAALVKKKERQILKTCFSCNKIIPIKDEECPHCHVRFIRDETKSKEDMPLTEFQFKPVKLDLIEQQTLDESYFHWIEWPEDGTLIANTVYAYALVCQKEHHHYILFVGKKGALPAIKYQGEKEDCIYHGAQFLANHTPNVDQHRQAEWLHKEITRGQIYMLQRCKYQPSNRYEASAFISYSLYAKHIESLKKQAKAIW